MNNERRIMGHILFKNGLYDIAAYDKEPLICIKDLGVKIEKPSIEIRYSDLYELDKDRLTLNTLRLEKCYGTFPVINGVKPRHSFGAFLYNKLKLPMQYTGTIIVTRGYEKIVEDDRSLLNRLFGWREMYRFTLQDGKIIKNEDISSFCERVRTLTGSDLVPINALIERDSREKTALGWRNLHENYSEYFSL